MLAGGAWRLRYATTASAVAEPRRTTANAAIQIRRPPRRRRLAGSGRTAGAFLRFFFRPFGRDTGGRLWMIRALINTPTFGATPQAGPAAPVMVTVMVTVTVR